MVVNKYTPHVCISGKYLGKLTLLFKKNIFVCWLIIVSKWICIAENMNIILIGGLKENKFTKPYMDKIPIAVEGVF